MDLVVTYDVHMGECAVFAQHSYLAEVDKRVPATDAIVVAGIHLCVSVVLVQYGAIVVGQPLCRELQLIRGRSHTAQVHMSPDQGLRVGVAL